MDALGWPGLRLPPPGATNQAEPGQSEHSWAISAATGGDGQHRGASALQTDQNHESCPLKDAPEESLANAELPHHRFAALHWRRGAF